MAFSLENSPFRSAQVGVIVTGPDSLIQYASASFSAITGYTAAELHGSDCKRLQGGSKNVLIIIYNIIYSYFMKYLIDHFFVKLLTVLFNLISE